MTTLDPYVRDISVLHYFQPLAITLANSIPESQLLELRTHLPKHLNNSNILGKIILVVLVPLWSLAETFVRLGLVLSLEVVFWIDLSFTVMSHLSSSTVHKLVNGARVVRVFVVSFFKSDPKDECIICRDPMLKEDSVKRPGCTPVCQTALIIHEECLKKCLIQGNKCPSCRKPGPLEKEKVNDVRLLDLPWSELANGMTSFEFSQRLRAIGISFKDEPSIFMRKYSISVRDLKEPVRIYFRQGKLIFPTPQYIKTNYLPILPPLPIRPPLLPNPIQPPPPLQNRHIAPIQNNLIKTFQPYLLKIALIAITAGTIFQNPPVVMVSFAMLSGYSMIAFTIAMISYRNPLDQGI